MNEQKILDSHSGVAALIAAGISIGKVQKNPHQGGKDFVLVPQSDGSVKVEYLERPDTPARKSGTVKVNDVESFIEATTRHKDDNHTVIYAALQPAQFLAVINDHQDSTRASQSGHDGARWRDHRVAFPLAHSNEWRAWLEKDGKTFAGQEEFAYFIENNLPDFKTPEGGRMLDIALNFRAKQSVSYKGAARLQNGSVELNYQEITEGSAGPTGKFTIPEEFTISIPVWTGLDQKKYIVEARLRYRVKSGGISIWYDLNRPHKVIEQAFADTLHTIETSLGKTPIIFGTPE